MFLIFILNFAFAAECPQRFGEQQNNGSWAFYREKINETIEVPESAILPDCSVDWEILEIKKGEIVVSNAKRAEKAARLIQEQEKIDTRKALTEKVRDGSIDLDNKEELKEVLKVLMEKEK